MAGEHHTIVDLLYMLGEKIPWVQVGTLAIVGAAWLRTHNNKRDVKNVSDRVSHLENGVIDGKIDAGFAGLARMLNEAGVTITTLSRMEKDEIDPLTPLTVLQAADSMNRPNPRKKKEEAP